MDWLTDVWGTVGPLVKMTLSVVVWPMLWKWGKAQWAQEKLTTAQEITIKAADVLAWILQTYIEQTPTPTPAVPQKGTAAVVPMIESAMMRRAQADAVQVLVGQGHSFKVADRAVAGAASRLRQAGGVVVI